MGKFYKAVTAEMQSKLYEKYPWFKDIKCDDIDFEFDKKGNITIISGVISAGTIPQTNMKFNCSFNAEDKLGELNLIGGGISVESAKAKCSIHIQGGTFVDIGYTSNTCISGGKFTRTSSFDYCVIIMNDSATPVFKPKTSAYMSDMHFNNCVFDEVNSSFMANIPTSGNIKLMSCLIHKLIIPPDADNRNIDISMCTILSGNALGGDSGLPYEISKSRIHNFTNTNINAEFYNCECYDCTLTNVKCEGDTSQIYNSKCVNCMFEPGSFENKPPDRMYFVNSSWDGGIFQGVFNQDSVWHMGSWKTSGKYDGAMFGWEVEYENEEYEVGNYPNKVMVKSKTYRGIPSKLSPKENPELFKLMTKLSIANQKVLGQTEGMHILIAFKRLCGAGGRNVYEEFLPITESQLLLMDDLTDSERQMIMDSVNTLKKWVVAYYGDY